MQPVIRETTLAPHFATDRSRDPEGSLVPSLSLCICAADRVAILDRCLTSIAQGTALPETVIVSDDSLDSAGTRAVCEQFPFVRYHGGPKRGLCANRNAAVAQAGTDYVSLIDDDGIVGRTFIEDLKSILPSLPAKTVVSGDVLEYGGRTVPSNPWFLGHFGRPYGAQQLQGINLNCNCLPRAAFDDAIFDEVLVYGYEDMDLCSNLLSQGYRFVHHPELVNQHVPPQQTAGFRRRRYRAKQKARFQTSMTRYLVWQNDPFLAFLYILAAPAHRILYALRHGLWADISCAVFDIVTATNQAVLRRFKKG